MTDVTMPRSVLFYCVSEVKRPSQALCWPVGLIDLIGRSTLLSPDLRALGATSMVTKKKHKYKEYRRVRFIVVTVLKYFSIC
jgi:hypothetical protein